MENLVPPCRDNFQIAFTWAKWSRVTEIPPIKAYQYFNSHIKAQFSIGLAGAIAPPLFSKIVLDAITNKAFSTEIFSKPNCCIYTRT